MILTVYSNIGFVINWTGNTQYIYSILLNPKRYDTTSSPTSKAYRVVCMLYGIRYMVYSILFGLFIGSFVVYA